MANQFYVPPPDLNNALQDLMTGVKSAQLNSARQQAVQSMQAGDTRGALARLMSIGDMQGVQALGSFGRDERDFAFRQQESQRAQSNADRSYGLQKQAVTRQETPAQLQILNAAGIDPKSPQGQKALFPRTDTPISATDKKAIFEAEDELPQLQGTQEALNRALELNDKTFTGPGAGFRGDAAQQAANLLGMKPKQEALATTEWSKIMGPEALQSMASTLKGATTDFELKKFIEMLADPSTDPTVRKGVIERMKRLTERKMEISKRRTDELRSGSYFKGSGGAQPQAPASQQFSNGMRARNPQTGAIVEFRDGQWVPAQ